jgi:hypothetical protein
MATLPRSRSLEEPPTEIIEKVAANLDNTALRALHATSRSIKDKSLHIYFENCFGVPKFCLHPFSLQALTDISHHQDFAKHVHTVAFGPEERGLIDPLHKEIVKRNDRYHSQPTSTPSMSLDTLKKMRERLDAHTIAQTLAKFPKLRLVMLGRHLELDGQPVRPSWGKATISELYCTSGHCKSARECRAADGARWVKTVFDTVGMALEQLERRNVKIHLGIDSEDLFHPRASQLGATTVWYPSADLQKRITGLHLHYAIRESIATVQLLINLLEPLTDNANISDLVFSYDPIAHGYPPHRPNVTL